MVPGPVSVTVVATVAGVVAVAVTAGEDAPDQSRVKPLKLSVDDGSRRPTRMSDPSVSPPDRPSATVAGGVEPLAYRTVNPAVWAILGAVHTSRTRLGEGVAVSCVTATGAVRTGVGRSPPPMERSRDGA